jgi:hypothetical protein
MENGSFVVLSLERSRREFLQKGLLRVFPKRKEETAEDAENAKLGLFSAVFPVSAVPSGS